LLSAYSHGYFPMPHPETEEIIWFNPDPRAILPLDGFHCSRSLMRSLKNSGFQLSLDQDFAGVMAGCADRPETWINAEISQAYLQLHRDGHAHSLEIWQNGGLVGGTYGVSIGGVFFAESKFHRVRDASKAAIYYLTEHLRDRNFSLLEVQFMTPHLQKLGVLELKAAQYQLRLGHALRQSVEFLPLRIPCHSKPFKLSTSSSAEPGSEKT
ncbi:MAG: leucyl/phenylalanyl-tRNA--protein transferase, partial [Proteobacteria bacterium]|nr:leucyl/phenylalanyl-tRNA--protein transferase [Pseudomonadota bacterium]